MSKTPIGSGWFVAKEIDGVVFVRASDLQDFALNLTKEKAALQLAVNELEQELKEVTASRDAVKALAEERSKILSSLREKWTYL